MLEKGIDTCNILTFKIFIIQSLIMTFMTVLMLALLRLLFGIIDAKTGRHLRKRKRYWANAYSMACNGGIGVCQ